MFTDDVISQITEAAIGLGLEPAALLAVAEVESAGQAFAMVNGRREPLIRFEGHYFDRRLSEQGRKTARAAGLSSPVAGGIANPKTQAARWRLVERAAAIDAKAAYESISWGLGQVMGAHWAWLGYASVDAMVAEARASIAGQTRLMVLYIEKAGLAAALKNRDWATFARGYNGPGYKQYAYDHKIAAAYRRYGGTGASGSPERLANGKAAPEILLRGSRGPAVLEMQRRLAGLGYTLDVDGAFGPGTAAAVKQFQSDRSLDADGVAGPRTLAALQAAIAAKPGLLAGVRAWLARLFARG